MKEGEEKENKEQITNLQIIGSKLYFVFCGSQETNSIINRSIIANTYQQIIELLHFTLLYTIYGETNNSTYDIVQAVLSSLIILVCFVPRLTQKYYSLLFTLIVFIIITLSSAGATALLIIDYNIFTNYCDILYNYSIKNKNFNFKASTLCTSITHLYYSELAFSCFIEVIRAIYIYLIVKAYQTSKSSYNLLEQNRRRQQKFNEKSKKKGRLFNINRKI